MPALPTFLTRSVYVPCASSTTCWSLNSLDFLGDRLQVAGPQAYVPRCCSDVSRGVRDAAFSKVRIDVGVAYVAIVRNYRKYLLQTRRPLILPAISQHTIACESRPAPESWQEKFPTPAKSRITCRTNWATESSSACQLCGEVVRLRICQVTCLVAGVGWDGENLFQ